MDLYGGNSTTITVSDGLILSVASADAFSSGIVRPIDPVTRSPTDVAISITVGLTKSIGPFVGDRTFNIEATQGRLIYETRRAEFGDETPAAARKQINTIAWAGTSRIAAQYLDPSQRNTSNAGWMNWAAGWLRAQGKPLITSGNFATSGFRTDQFAPAIERAIATGAAMVGFDGPINDFAFGGVGYPSAATTVATALAITKGYIKAINDAGAIAVYVLETGSQGMTAAQIGFVNDFNRLFCDYVQYGDDFRGPPNIIVLDPSPYRLTTSSNGTIALKNSHDGIHDNITAAQVQGLAFANKLAQYLRELPGHRLRSLNQSRATNGARSMIQSAGLAGSVAVSGTGNTGNLPTNVTAGNCTGLVTCAYSIEDTVADADGNTWGKQVKMTVTATGAGVAKCNISLDKTLLVAGDIVRGGMEIDVAASTGLAAVRSDLEWFPSTGGTTPTFDMFDSTFGTDPGGYSGFVTEPPPLLITPFTGTPFTNLSLAVSMSGAGGAVVIFRKPWAERATQ